jgi:hypothetical protein
VVALGFVAGCRSRSTSVFIINMLRQAWRSGPTIRFLVFPVTEERGGGRQQFDAIAALARPRAALS